MNELGAFITRLRKDKNMTQAQVAEKLDVTYQAVSKWERGESMPDITLLPAIADLFDVSIDELVRGAFHEKEQDKIEFVKELAQEEVKEEKVKDEEPNKEEEKEENYFNNFEFDGSFVDLIDKISPIVKPMKLEKVLRDVVDRVNKSTEEVKQQWKAQSKRFYPYFSPEDLTKMVLSDYIDDYDEMIPFLNSEQKTT